MPGVVLANRFAMSLPGGKVIEGNLVATADGLQLHNERRNRLITKRLSRYSLVRWGEVKHYELTCIEVTKKINTSGRGVFEPINLAHATDIMTTQPISVLLLITGTQRIVLRCPLSLSRMHEILDRQLVAIDGRAEIV